MAPPVVLHARGLLFDLDGVLADSTDSVEAHWRRWATSHSIDPDTLLRVVHGRRAIDTIREMTPQLDPEAELAVLAAAEAADTSGVVALPGAQALLARLPAHGWAIVTSGVRSVAEARLRASNLPLPSVLVSAEAIERGKPDPEGYLVAAARLGVPVAACVVIEDAPVGVAAAQAAGMACVALTTTHSAPELTGARLVVPSLDALQVSVAANPDGTVHFTIAAKLGSMRAEA